MDEPEQSRLPAALWVEGHLRRLNAQGISYYIAQKGAYDRGTVLLKINMLNGQCRLLMQQRDMSGKLQWIDAMNEEMPAEAKADDYIKRAVSRDPDLWAIEIENGGGENPFYED